MPTTPQITQIYLYPIKGLDGWQTSTAQVTEGGSLQYDRRWAFSRLSPSLGKSDLPTQKQIVNAKTEPRWLTVRSIYEQCQSTADSVRLELQLDQQSYTLQLPNDTQRISQIVSEYLGYAVELRENQVTGFPDDQFATGPTLIGSATLTALSDYLRQVPLRTESIDQTDPLFSTHDLFRRLRSNILLATDEVLWEDRLFNSPEQMQAFQLGDVELWGTNPCKRCAVPAHDPVTGDLNPSFIRAVMAWRKQQSPDYSHYHYWDNPYRLAVNTLIKTYQPGHTIRVGDELKLFTP